MYMLGKTYFEGRGVDADLEKAYSWFYRAHRNGLANAKKAKEMVGKKLQAFQIQNAEQASDQWIAQHRSDL